MKDIKSYLKIYKDKFHREVREFDMISLEEDLIADGYTKHKATRLAKEIANKYLSFGVSVTVRPADTDGGGCVDPSYGNILPSSRMFG